MRAHGFYKFALITIIDETSHAKRDKIGLFTFPVAKGATEDVLVERTGVRHRDGGLIAEASLMLRRRRVGLATMLRCEAAAALLGPEAT